MGFPIADQFMLPFATLVPSSYKKVTNAQLALTSNYNYEKENSYQRKKDIAKFLAIFEGEPTDILILTGSNRGKTVLSKELAGFCYFSLKIIRR